jgi:hypothetical protein
MTFRTPSFAAALLAGTLLVGGCESDSKSHDSDHDGIADKYDRRPNSPSRKDDDVISRDPLDRRDDTLDRASSDRRGLDDVPRDAVRVDSGTGMDVLRYPARRDGRIYVYDQTDDRVVYKGKLNGGEEFVMDPSRDVLSVNGKRLEDVSLRERHVYRVYFMRD